MKAILFILGYLLLMNLTLADVGNKVSNEPGSQTTTSAPPSTTASKATNLGVPSVLLPSLVLATFHLFRLY